MSARDEKKLTAPKFSSFKAKATSTPDPPAQSTKDEKNEERKDRRHRERVASKESRHTDTNTKHRLEHRQRHHDRKRSRSPAPEATKTPAIELKSRQDGEGELLFIVDARGDPLISRYHTNDRGKVPNYWRDGGGRVLGADGYLSLHRDGAKEEFTLRRPGEGSSAFRDKNLFQSKIRRIKPRTIRVRRDLDESRIGATEPEDFLPLRSSKHRRREEDGPNMSGDDKPTYRSIEGKAKAHEFSDSDLNFDSDSTDQEGQELENPVKKKSIELSRQVKEHPGDIGSWIELINHQDVLMRAGESIEHEVTEGEVSSYAQIKISMFESALSHTASHRDKEKLLLGLMLEGTKVWSPSTLASRWETVAKDHKGSFALWKAWVDFKLANLLTFQYQEVRSTLLDRLAALPAQETHPISPLAGSEVANDSKALYEQMIYVFLRTTRYVHDAGYKELAVAAWQALLELNLFRPAKYDNLASSEVLDSLKDFWESEVARVGENDAMGWDSYVRSNGDLDPPEPRVYDSSSAPKSRDIYKVWGATELLRAQQSKRPARAMDEGIEDDPYRVVMYSDIESFLFVIPSSAVPSVRHQLLVAFLLFCQLPSPPGENQWTRMASTDTYIVGGMTIFQRDVCQKTGDTGHEDGTKRMPSFFQDGLQVSVSPELLFAGPDWFRYLTSWISSSKDREGPVEFPWILNALRQLGRNGQSRDLAEYCLAMEWLNDPTSIKKRAKAILKQYPSDMRLYNAYALAEWTNGNTDVARNVVAAATDLAFSGAESGAQGGLLLWTTWAWMDLESGDKPSALLRLCSVIEESLRKSNDGKAVTSTQLLKARQALSAGRDYSLSAGELNHAVLNAMCLALLHYLTAQGGSEPMSGGQGNISAAMDSIWVLSGEICSRRLSETAAHERLLQYAARLLYFNASKGPFRRAYLREQLTKCISLFPRNTIFLTLFAWASSTFGIDDPVRDILRNTVLVDPADSISSRMFAIRHELNRGNVHSTRAAFENAMESVACRSNPDMWRCYIKFSHSRKELRPKAKEVFFRALRYCPWSKELAMEAFLTLINVMDELELRSVFNTMATKGLRIHVDLEEFVTSHKDKRT